MKNILKTFSIRLCLVLSALIAAPHSSAQDSSSRANIVFTDALRIYNESLAEGPEAQTSAAIEILRLFDLIVTVYPESIPAKRITEGGRLGPIDMQDLRAQAGIEDTPLPETPSDAPLLSDLSSLVQEAVAEAAMAAPPEWYQRALPTGAPAGGYGHGLFPSLGQRTHSGIDLISACEQEVVAPWHGVVEAVIKAGDPAFPVLGNGVILRHSAHWEQPVYTGYFHLGSTPTAKVGDIEKGTKIGVAGMLHDLSSCGVHLEVVIPAEGSNAEAESVFDFAYWNSDFGIGDWSNDPDFTNFWANPEAWLTQLALIESGDHRNPRLLAQDEWVAIYTPGVLGQFNEPIRQYLHGPREQGLRLTSVIDLERDPLGVLITITHQTGILNTLATEAVIQASDQLEFSIRASVYKLGQESQPLISTQVKLPSSFSGGRYIWLSEPTELLLLADDIIGGDFIRLEMVSSENTVFSLGTDIAYGARLPNPDDVGPLIANAEALAAKIKACFNWSRAEGMMITFSVIEGAANENVLGVGSATLIESQNLPQGLVNVITGQFTRRPLSAICRSRSISVQGIQNMSWPPLEIVLGRPAK